MANATQEELESLAMFYQEKDVKEDEIWREEGDFSLKQERGKSEYKAFWKNFDKNSNRVGIKMFFMPFRLLAYAFLVLGFFILLKQDYLDILGFFSGLVVANIMIVGFYFLKM